MRWPFKRQPKTAAQASDSAAAPPVNLDLIQRVQQARMQHDASARPSQISAAYWIEAKAPAGKAAAPTPRSGEWQIATTLTDVDALWAKISAATIAGELSYKAKVSTRPAAGQSDSDARLICVRMADMDDSAELARIEAALRRLGIEGPLRAVRDYED